MTADAFPHIPQPGRKAVVFAVLAFAGYFVTLHALIVSGEWPIVSLALVCLPWLVALLSSLLAPVASSRARALRRSLALAVVAVVAWTGWRFGAGIAPRADLLLYLENVVFFVALCALFTRSLLPGREALVARLARITRNGDMPPAVMRYTRHVTVAWAGFFAIVPVVSSVLYFTQSRTVWSTFVNLAIGPLVVAAFVLEYVVRLRVLRDITHKPLMAGIQAFRHRSTIDATGERR